MKTCKCACRCWLACDRDCSCVRECEVAPAGLAMTWKPHHSRPDYLPGARGPVCRCNCSVMCVRFHRADGTLWHGSGLSWQRRPGGAFLLSCLSACRQSASVPYIRRQVIIPRELSWLLSIYRIGHDGLTHSLKIRSHT